jgi:DNA polymerase-1
VIVEIDFKQLEVCALAWLTQDIQLMADLSEGRDVHTEVGKHCGLDMTNKKARRDVKTIVFAMIYGAGAKGIAKSSGLPIGLVKDVIKVFYDRYSSVHGFYRNLTEKVMEHGTRMDIVVRGPAGPDHLFEWVSPTGRTYMFNQDPYRPGPKYTQLRNYPVQGTATADIVPMVMAEVANVLRNMPETHKVHLITQTHDSVTLDCYNRDDAVHAVRELQYKVFKDIEDLINEKFPGIEWHIPLNIEVEIGPNWGDMKPLDIELHT